MKVTYRQLMYLTNAAEVLKGKGTFNFRCMLAGLVLEANQKIEAFNEARKTSKGMQDFQEEIQLHRENCTVERNGKKEIDIPAFMPLYAKAKLTHAKAIEASEKNQEEANKALDTLVDINASPISVSLLEESDKQEKFDISTLSKLLPFIG